LLTAIAQIRCALCPASARLLLEFTALPVHGQAPLFHCSLWLASIASDTHVIPDGDDSIPTYVAPNDSKLHLLAMHDLALLALVHCESVEIRTAAFELISALNVTNTITTLRGENKVLRTKIDETLREVNMLKSMTALPF
jgi:hypothetical protein